MNELQIFNNNDFGQVRTIKVDGQILFCGSDVAKALGYSTPSKAVQVHCKGVAKMEVPTNGGRQKMLFVKEGDLYRLVINSKLPNAEKFEEWVFDEVLPIIRQTGRYGNKLREEDKIKILSLVLKAPKHTLGLAVKLIEEFYGINLSNEIVPIIKLNETELSRFCKTHLILGRPTNEVHADYVKFCDGEPLSKTEFSKQIKKELNCVIVDKKVNGEKRRMFEV